MPKTYDEIMKDFEERVEYLLKDLRESIPGLISDLLTHDENFVWRVSSIQNSLQGIENLASNTRYEIAKKEETT